MASPYVGAPADMGSCIPDRGGDRGIPLSDAVRLLSDRYDTAIVTLAGNCCLPIGRAQLLAHLQKSSLSSALESILPIGELRSRTTPSGMIIYLQKGDAGEAPGPADPPVRMAELVVQGREHRLSERLTAKYRSRGVVDILAATDIESFSDRNAAETLDRLPGVAISRDGSEGRQVSVRGMDAGATLIRMNGMEILATGESIDARGSLNRSRSFDFNVFSLDSLQRAALYKTASADREEGGIAGTIDLHTPAPFDRAGQREFSLKTGYNTNAAGMTSGGRALWAESWQDGKQAALLSLSYDGQRAREVGFSTVRWSSGGWDPDKVDGSVPGDWLARLNGDGDDALFRSRYNRYDIISREGEAASAVAAWQFRPSDSLSLSANAIRAEHDLLIAERHLDSAGLGAGDASSISINDLAVEGNDIVHGDFDGVDIHSELNSEARSTLFQQVTLESEYMLEPGWKLLGYLGYARAGFDSPVHDKVWFNAGDRHFSYDYRNNHRVSANRYGFDINDPDQWRLYRVLAREDRVDNRFRQARIDSVFDIGGSTGTGRLSTGLSYRQYTHSGETYRSYFYDVQGEAVSGLYDHVEFSGLGVGSVPDRWLTPSLESLQKLSVAERNPEPDRESLFSVHEASWAAYLKWERAWNWHSGRVHLDTGLRYSATALQSRGFLVVDTRAEQIETRSGYDNWLPSLNLSSTVSDHWLVRFSAGRNITRPAPSDLRAGVRIDPGENTATLGNPELDPLRATAVDLSLEHYSSDREDMAALGLFYKKIEESVVWQSASTTDAALERLFPSMNLEPVAKGADAAAGEYSLSRAVNGDNVYLHGAELSLTHRLGLFPRFWDKSSVNFNYVYSAADHRYPVEGAKVVKPLIGLSKHSASLAYRGELGQWRVNLSASHRSRYLSEVPGGNGNDEAGVNASLYGDLSVHYRLSDSLNIKFSALNLSNEPLDQYVDSSNRVYSYSRSGRDYLLEFVWRG